MQISKLHAEYEIAPMLQIWMRQLWVVRLKRALIKHKKKRNSWSCLFYWKVWIQTYRHVVSHNRPTLFLLVHSFVLKNYMSFREYFVNWLNVRSLNNLRLYITYNSIYTCLWKPWKRYQRVVKTHLQKVCPSGNSLMNGVHITYYIFNWIYSQKWNRTIE